jgi:hypothetical protein
MTDPRDPALVPATIADSVRAYLAGGRRPGSFLAAVLENDLKLAALKADPARPGGDRLPRPHDASRERLGLPVRRGRVGRPPRPHGLGETPA